MGTIKEHKIYQSLLHLFPINGDSGVDILVVGHGLVADPGSSQNQDEEGGHDVTPHETPNSVEDPGVKKGQQRISLLSDAVHLL